MKIMALDLAALSGWAWSQPSPSTVRSGAVRLARVPVGDEMGGVFCKLHDWLDEHKAVLGIDCLAVEAAITPRAGGKTVSNQHTQMMLIGLVNHAESWAFRNKVPFYTISVTTARAYVLNDGFAGKPGAMRWCHEMGYDVRDDNEADALVLLAYAEASQRGIPSVGKPIGAKQPRLPLSQ